MPDDNGDPFNPASAAFVGADHVDDPPPRPTIELARGPDGTWRGPPGSAALLGDRGDVAARTPADLAGLVFGCWASGVDLVFLGNGSGGGALGGAGAHAGAGPRRPDRTPDPRENGLSDEDAAELCRLIFAEHRRGS
jgi:hypothetical protein